MTHFGRMIEKPGMNNRLFMLTYCVLILASLLSGCEKQISAGFSVGSHAPSLPTKTLVDVEGNLSKITTYRQPDSRMYQFSVDKALLTGKPIVLEFATPGHCTNCDEQLQMLRAVMDKFQDQMIFIHIDQYANPQAYKAYKVMGDPWTFIIDKNGVVRFERAGRMLIGELNDAINQTL
jgi:thiol-disulfide isomerase/thioredoxin